MGQDQPFISFITTCKGRLAHLKETLPALVSQDDSEVIVVDYDCPDGTAQWLGDNYPQCTVVAVGDKPTFNLSDARNHGLRAARGRWLFFVDADVVLSHDIAARLREQLSDQHFYLLANFRNQGAYGSVLVARSAVDKIGEWDSQYVGYGGEDYDFFRRLTYTGLSMAFLKTEPVRMVPHSREERTRFYTVSKRQSLATAKMYFAAKTDLLKMHRSVKVPADVLVNLRARCEQVVKQALDEGRTTTSITIQLQPERGLFPHEDGRTHTVRRKLILEIDLDP
jgi:glycosyltransferase involved in cell wall biosynthesis